jgi:hypothetical protein
VLKNSHIEAVVANAEQVAQLVHTSTAGRATAWGLGALVFLPLAIPAVVDGVKSSEANQILDADFSAKCAQECPIPPRAIKNHVIFIHNHSFQSSFELTLVGKEKEEESSQLKYRVEL